MNLSFLFDTGETPDIRDFNKVAWLQTFPDVGDTNMPRQWVWALAAVEVMIQFASSPRSRFSHGCPRALHATATCTIYIAHFSTEAMPYRAILTTTCTKILQFRSIEGSITLVKLTRLTVAISCHGRSEDGKSLCGDYHHSSS